MKKIVIMLSLMLFITGCDVSVVDVTNYDSVIDSLMNKEVVANQNSNGYKFYIPTNVSILNTMSDNHVFLANNNKIYMYVDLISYYHKNTLEESKEDVFYFKKIEYNDKIGYIKIEQDKSEFKIMINLNYVIMETIVVKENIEEYLYLMIEIINSVEFNDEIISRNMLEIDLTSKNEVYDLFAKDDNQVDYSDYIKEYDNFDDQYGELKDEDLILREE